MYLCEAKRETLMLPNDFIESTRATFGEALWEQYLGAFDSGAPVSIRLNRRKATDGIAGNGHERVAWCDDGIYLGERPQFTFDPLLHAGAYYVQEASSMFLHHVMKHVLGKEPLLMIDMCAAPGGKSTLACSLLPEGSMIVSNEPVAQRASILSENMKKWGMPNVVVTNNYPRDIRKTGITADIVLCDVPCSGEGMFRKDEATIGEWSMKNVEKCSAMQREIVSEAWQCLRQGGIMIYSTCTFNTRENEENVRWISESMDGEIIEIPTEKEWGITGSLLPGFDEPVYRFIPGRTRGEGLFMAVIRKKGECTQRMPKMKVNDKEKSSTEWLKNPEEYVVEQNGLNITATPKAWQPTVKHLAKELRVVHAGISLGTVKGKDIIPDQCLALSTELKSDAFPKAEVDWQTAIAFLRKEAITLDADTPRGHVLLTYRQMPLGFVKNLGNRANNLYPAEWRIKTTHVPNWS